MPTPERVIYEVELFVDEEVAEDFLRWLRVHIVDLLQIEGFLDASIERRDGLDEDEEAQQRRFCVRYELSDRVALERYLRDDATRMRGEASSRFEGHFHAERSVLTSAAEFVEPQRLYARLLASTMALFEDERDVIANMANFAALLWGELPQINWVGFYLRRGDQRLILGPFQGKTACVRIPVGQGVCGSAAANAESLVVEDVHAFDGHIACDAASRSELVLPIVLDGATLGVLDIDSPIPARFDALDREGLEAVLGAFVERSDWSPLASEERFS